MPKAKPAPKKKSSPRTIVKRAKPAAKKSVPRQPAVKRTQPAAATKTSYSEEYVEYLERYALYGAGRPQLSPTDFDRLDDELLDLLAQEMEGRLDDDQIIRVKELEYLLLDSEQ